MCMLLKIPGAWFLKSSEQLFCFTLNAMPASFVLQEVNHPFHYSKADSGYTIIKLLFTFLKDAHRGRRKALLTEKLFTQRALVLALEEKPAMKSMGLQSYINMQYNQSVKKMVQEFIILNIFFCNMNIKMLSIFWDLVLLLVTVQSTSQVIPNLQFPLRCISTLSDNKLY